MREVLYRREISPARWIITHRPWSEAVRNGHGSVKSQTPSCTGSPFQSGTEMCREVGSWLINPDQTDKNLVRPVRDNLGLHLGHKGSRLLSVQWGHIGHRSNSRLPLGFSRRRCFSSPAVPHCPTPDLPARTSRKSRDTCSSLTTE